MMKQIDKLIVNRWTMLICSAIWFGVCLKSQIAGDKPMFYLAGIVSVIAGFLCVVMTGWKEK